MTKVEVRRLDSAKTAVAIIGVPAFTAAIALAVLWAICQLDACVVSSFNGPSVGPVIVR